MTVGSRLSASVIRSNQSNPAQKGSAVVPVETTDPSRRRHSLAPLEKVWRAFVVAQCWLTGAILAGIVLVSLINVLMRYVFASSIVWADEVARMSFIVVSFLGAGLAVAFGSHLVIDTLVGLTDAERLWGKIWRWLIVAISIAFFVMLIVGGLEQASRNFGQVSPALRISLGYIYLAIPVGAAIMLVNYLGVLLFGPRDLPAQEERPALTQAVQEGREVI